MSRTFVIGYDGSSAARAALSHALDRAGEDGHVVVVHACAVGGELVSPELYGPVLDRALERGRELLSEIAEVDARAVPPLVETELVSTDAATALSAVARARDADGIVVGTRGFGRARALLGSVAHELIHKAECPVTVIPERAVVRRRAAALAPLGQ